MIPIFILILSLLACSLPTKTSEHTMRLFIFILLLILGLAFADQAYPTPNQVFNMMTSHTSDHNVVRSIEYLQQSMPFAQEAQANAVENSVLSAISNDANCNSAICQLTSDSTCIFESFFEIFFNGTLDANLLANCYSECMGVFYECGGILSSTCEIYGINQTTCASGEALSDDDTSSSTTSSMTFTNGTGTWTGTSTWTSTSTSTTDDFNVTQICGDDCFSTYFGSYVNAMAICGPSAMEENATDLIPLNIVCSTNSANEYCLNYFTDDSEYVNCSDWTSFNSSYCSIVTDMGCCASTAMLFAPTCFNEFASSVCGISSTDICTDGMFVDMSIVTTSMSFDTYWDLDDESTSNILREDLADAIDSSTVEIEDEFISITTWSGSAVRKLRQEGRKLAASTSFDFNVNLVGTYISSADVTAIVESSNFTDYMTTSTGSTSVITGTPITTSVTATTAAPTPAPTPGPSSTPTMAPTINGTMDDDAAFSTPMNMALVLASMFLGLVMFF